MSENLVWVDAFSDGPFTGNPAAVCLLESPAHDDWMQALAAELGLSETAFVQRRGATFALRWFAPGAEMALCGHATLAAAHVLREHGWVRATEPMVFATRSGTLGVTARGALLEMDIPAAEGAPAALPPYAGPASRACARSEHFLVLELADEAAVAAFVPDLAAITRAGPEMVLVTAPGAAAGVDYVLRGFFPQVGIDEDPVTGSAQCVLGPYWSERLGGHDLHVAQLSARGGALRVSVAGDRVRIAGSATTVFSGSIEVP